MIKMSQVVASTALVSMSLFGGAALADSASSTVAVEGDRPQITIVGEGRLSVTPDVMKLDAGVEVIRPTAGEAFTAARAAAAALTKALLAAGIAAKDLRTNELSLGPQYKDYPTISGYRAAQGVEAVVRDIDAADDVVDAAVAAGEAVRLDSISFEVSDNRAPLRLAREAAFRDARTRAAQYARLAGRRLGRALEISEENVTPPRPFFAAGAMADKASISPGRQDMSVSVRVVYELD
ncbi:SIMPL domain-containing protein [Streptosporangium sp. NBC_01755]|uniref:SIMPL domain-containing protein n=1 Tax=unclassified Streptosporangium TaxID=2632669 RepID=UPI002DD980B0|nr:MULTISPECIES: SIMPL domain-containing protein [unclassified Streptosporangium]WSA22991.1 SIMPL domain-containing protein [Streptosporangium sp. NBC_01810]WSC98866.1 SIMPL domain-containing protein [Streptosporangium sp. NBC_01755]